ncbi:MAG: hypothetical protein IPM56_07415 [Ignavibacteriales bacterium]|nr:MAG: hypothetical protein IPM56_07415 [Ignavibacteriales bacterium]
MADVFYFGIHVAAGYGQQKSIYHLASDGGLAEFYKYLKYIWISLLIIYISVKKRSFSYVTLSFIFLYMFLDDALMLHEHGGNLLNSTFTFIPPYEIGHRDFGELIFLALMLLMILIPVYLTYRKGSPYFRKFCADIFILLALMLAGVFCMDSLSKFFEKGDGILTLIFTSARDGGDMVFSSVINAYLYARATSKDQNYFLVDFIPLIFRRRIFKDEG